MKDGDIFSVPATQHMYACSAWLDETADDVFVFLLERINSQLVPRTRSHVQSHDLSVRSAEIDLISTGNLLRGEQ